MSIILLPRILISVKIMAVRRVSIIRISLSKIRKRSRRPETVGRVKIKRLIPLKKVRLLIPKKL